jgi:hypothetical protein
MDRNEFPLDPRQVGVPSVVPKMIFDPMVRSVQTMHLSSVEINTISKQTETRFHVTHFTLEFHRVCPKRLPCPWYIRHKLCTYLASRLTLSPIGPKWVSIWPTSRRSTIGGTQNDFQAYITFAAICATIMHRNQYYLKTDRNDLPFHPRHLGVASGVPKIIAMPMVHSV